MDNNDFTKEFGKKECFEFGEYLKRDKESMFCLDLSNSTLIECIYKMCEIKSRSHPNILKDYSMVLHKIEKLQSYNI